MDVTIADKKLRRAIDDDSLRGRYGADMAKKIALRLGSLRAAESLADFWPPKSGPERCHELIGDRAELFSMDLKQPYRLLFKPIEVAPLPDRSNQQERWKLVKSIEIVAIENTHD